MTRLLPVLAGFAWALTALLACSGAGAADAAQGDTTRADVSSVDSPA